MASRSPGTARVCVISHGRAWPRGPAAWRAGRPAGPDVSGRFASGLGGFSWWLEFLEAMAGSFLSLAENYN